MIRVWRSSILQTQETNNDSIINKLDTVDIWFGAHMYNQQPAEVLTVTLIIVSRSVLR